MQESIAKIRLTTGGIVTHPHTMNLRERGKSGMSFLPKSTVTEIVRVAIDKRIVLDVTYHHTDGTEVVTHRLAPFDIGTTNPERVRQFVDSLWAYTYTHKDKQGNPSPKVCRFDVKNFSRMDFSDDCFDETDLTDRNLIATNYDYRKCNFALLPDRHWYGR